MISAFGVEHGEISKRTPFPAAGDLKTLLAPYRGGVSTGAKTVKDVYPGQKTMALRRARRQAAAPRQPKPGEAMR